MAIPKTLSTDPHAVLNPDDRWRPGAGEGLRGMQSGLPPLVDKVRNAVKQWREGGYSDVSDTTRALLRWWFCRPPEETEGKLRYYFAQREAMESIVFLYEMKKARDKHELMRFSSGGVDPVQMKEEWARYVVKMATGSGKTKVISLVILWSYFHKIYEQNSPLSRNVLLVAPNIIVLDRLYRDFAGLRIFGEDGAIPENGWEGRDWRNDFRMRLHKQDDVRGMQTPGNLYLTNIHRVYSGDDIPPSAYDENSRVYFFGERAMDVRDSGVQLSDIVRNSGELLIINDEAHHIHDEKMAWFRSIEEIHNMMVQNGRTLSLQADFTATPKHNNGAIFPQTISDYPLVEAIHQNIVKRPVVPDDASAAKLKMRQHPKYAEQCADFLELGVKEWRKARDEHAKANKKAVLFVMTQNTRDCDELAEYLQDKYKDLTGKVLVIHTKKNGEIGEAAQGQTVKELQRMRKAAAEIDNFDNDYAAVVSVLVLREGWDVKNVTTIIGLRAYSAESKILPEQTLGRGVRLMYGGGDGKGERVSVIGTPAFSEFVREIEKEGVKLEKVQMGDPTPAQAPRIVAIDRDNADKDIAALDIAVPVLSRRFDNYHSKVFGLRAENIAVQPVEYRRYDAAEDREIIFRDILTDEVSHKTILGDGKAQDYSIVIGYFVRRLMGQFKFFSRYDFFYALVESFVRDFLFGETVPLEDERTLRNLAETPTAKVLLEAVSAAILAAIRVEIGEVRIQREIKISDMRPFAVDDKRDCHAPKKSAQNWIVDDNSKLELDFAGFLDSCADAPAYAKNYFAVGFALDYVKEGGIISRFFPDFLAKDAAGKVWVIETKGRMDENDRRKMKRLMQWRDDVRKLLGESAAGCLWVREDDFRKHRPGGFAELVRMCESPAAE